MQTAENTTAIIVDTYYTIAELCELLKISRTTIDSLVKQKQLSKTKVGKKTLFSAIEVNRYLASNTKN